MDEPKLVLPMRMYAGCEHPGGDSDYGFSPGQCMVYAPDYEVTNNRTANQIREAWGLAEGDIDPLVGFLTVSGRKTNYICYN